MRSLSTYRYAHSRCITQRTISSSPNCRHAPSVTRQPLVLGRLHNRTFDFSRSRRNHAIVGCPTILSARWASTTTAPAPSPEAKPDNLGQFHPGLVRSYAIIAHIDHGKSTLADRLLEVTGTIEPGSGNKQVLDKLKVERERGITVKAQSASMFYRPFPGSPTYLLNLIDTPGHVDFSSEVSRSLLAVNGAILLVDASQGVQAQTLSVLEAAKKRGLEIIPVLNKIDLGNAEVERVEQEVRGLLGMKEGEGEVLKISAKTGMGVDKVLRKIVERVPPPRGDVDGKLRCLVFDSWFDQFKGVVNLIAVMDGKVVKGDKISCFHSRRNYEVTDVGMMHPDPVSLAKTGLRAGQVGFLTCNMKEPGDAVLGDTFFHSGQTVEPLEGFRETKPMVFAGVYPYEPAQFPQLEESVKRLALNDRSVDVQRESSAALGQGFRLGFLGTLHMDVFRQRLEDEYDSEVIVTRPFVPVKVIKRDGSEKLIDNPADFPEPSSFIGKVVEVREPTVRATVIAPDDFTGPIMELCSAHRGTQLSFNYLDSSSSRIALVYSMPLSSIVTTFHSNLKSLTSGYASFDYEESDWESSDLVKMNVLLNGKGVDALASVVHKSKVEKEARGWVGRLKDVIPRQQFEIIIQAAVGSKIFARERISPVRKDVTVGLYGGHYERKLKHLNKQKEGKKRLKQIGSVHVPQEAFYAVLGADSGSSKK